MISLSFPLLIISGITAYIISSWLLVLLRFTGLTRYSPRLYWACGAFGGVTGAALLGGRLLRALVMSVLIPLLYVVVYEVTGNADLQFGAMLGVGHGIAVGLVLPLIGNRAGCRQAPAPGLFGWRLGPITPLLLLIVYALYGAALGYVYVVVSP